MAMVDLLAPLIRIALDRFGDVKVLNKPNLFDSGGVLIASNHKGWADCLWLAYAVYPHKLFFLSKKELFDKTLHRLFFENVGALPINRGRPSARSIRMACGILERGGILLVFPSGTRTEDRVPVKRGAATIAYHAKTPVIPAFYKGPESIEFKHIFVKPQIVVAFGHPIWMTEGGGKEDILKASEEIQIEIDRLRDYLAGHRPS